MKSLSTFTFLLPAFFPVPGCLPAAYLRAAYFLPTFCLLSAYYLLTSHLLSAYFHPPGVKLRLAEALLLVVYRVSQRQDALPAGLPCSRLMPPPLTALLFSLALLLILAEFSAAVAVLRLWCIWQYEGGSAGVRRVG